jgi:hypothetical protein
VLDVKYGKGRAFDICLIYPENAILLKNNENAILLKNNEKALTNNESNFIKMTELEIECNYCGEIFNCAANLDRHRDDDSLFGMDYGQEEENNICGFCLLNIRDVKKKININVY